MLFSFSTITKAEDVGIHGSIGIKHELIDITQPNQLWEIDLYYRFNNWFSVGLTESTSTTDFIPINQLYGFYINFDLNNNISLKLCQWSYHPIWSNNPIPVTTNVPNGVYIEGKYKF
jgi:hypothetical protein